MMTIFATPLSCSTTHKAQGTRVLLHWRVYRLRILTLLLNQQGVALVEQFAGTLEGISLI